MAFRSATEIVSVLSKPPSQISLRIYLKIVTHLLKDTCGRSRSHQMLPRVSVRTQVTRDSGSAGHLPAHVPTVVKGVNNFNNFNFNAIA